MSWASKFEATTNTARLDALRRALVRRVDREVAHERRQRAPKMRARLEEILRRLDVNDMTDDRRRELYREAKALRAELES